MSAFLGSSAINKSGKKFAPKVARRRAAAVAGSDAASATSSAEQTPGSTPAPSTTLTNEPVQPESQDVLPTPPSTQAPSHPPPAQATVIGYSVSPTLQPVPIAVPSAPTQPDELEAGGRSPKRRRIEAPDPTLVISAPQVLSTVPVSSEAAQPIVTTTPAKRAATLDAQVTGSAAPQGSAGAIEDDIPQGERVEDHADGREPDAEANAGIAWTSNGPKSKKITQPKAVKRRSASRVSNEDLIRDVMGQNTGATNTSTSTTVPERSSAQPETQSGTPVDDPPAGGDAIAPAGPTVESIEDAPGPARASRRAPNVTAARRKRQQTAPSASIDQSPADPRNASQDGASDIAVVTDGVQEADGTAPIVTTKKARQPRAKKRVVADTQSAGEGSSSVVEAPKPRRPRKKQPKSSALVNDQDGEGAVGGAAGPESEQPAADQNAAARKRPRSISAHLIFDAEDRENPEKTRIDATSMPMGVLTKDIPFVGTVTQREEALSKIDWDEEKRKRMEERERIAMGEEVAHTQVERDAALARLQEAANNAVVQAPRMRVVNGNLVLDTASTQVDRHAQAREDAEELQEVEEDELTTRVNQMSWIKANRKDPRERTTWGPTRADRWSDEQTEMFYDALKMFGTDFFIISKMFPGKSRANVKRKFVKEERLNPDRIKRVLIGESVPMDFEEYKRKTGKGDDFFRDPEQLRRELEQETEQQKQEVEEAQAKYAEQQRQRKLAKQGGADIEGEEGEGASGKKGRKKKGEGSKRKKNKAPIGGEEIEVVEFDGDELEHRR